MLQTNLFVVLFFFALPLFCLNTVILRINYVPSSSSSRGGGDGAESSSSSNSSIVLNNFSFVCLSLSLSLSTPLFESSLALN